MTLSLDWRLRKHRLTGFHNEGVIEREPRSLHIAGRGPSLTRAIVADQRVRDPEDDVAIEIFAAPNKDLRDERLEALLERKKMDMRGPVGMAVLRAQKVADRTVSRNGVGARYDRSEREASFFVGDELASQIHIALRIVLVLIKTD